MIVADRFPTPFSALDFENYLLFAEQDSVQYLRVACLSSIFPRLTDATDTFSSGWTPTLLSILPGKHRFSTHYPLRPSPGQRPLTHYMECLFMARELLRRQYLMHTLGILRRLLTHIVPRLSSKSPIPCNIPGIAPVEYSFLPLSRFQILTTPTWTCRATPTSLIRRNRPRHHTSG